MKGMTDGNGSTPNSAASDGKDATANPVMPTNHGASSKPAGPTNHGASSKPTGPTNHVASSKPTGPTNHVASSNPTGPTNHGASSKPGAGGADRGLNTSGEMQPRYPHSFRMLTVRGIYGRLSLALFVMLIAAVWRGGMPVVALTLSAVAGAILAELVVGMFDDTSIRRSGIGNGRAVYYALLVAALVPPGTAPVVTAAAAAAAVWIGLWLPGGSGSYWMHPVFVGLALIPGVALAVGVDPIASVETEWVARIEASGIFRWIEARVFAPFDLGITPQAVAAVFGLGPTVPTSVTAGLLLPLLVGTMIVFGEDLVPPSLPVLYLITFVAVVELTGGDLLIAVLGGNVPVVAILALSDPGVRPHRRGATALFAVIAGAVTALLTSYAGAAFPAVAAMLLVGTMRPLFDRPVFAGARGRGAFR